MNEIHAFAEQFPATNAETDTGFPDDLSCDTAERTMLSSFRIEELLRRIDRKLDAVFRLEEGARSCWACGGTSFDEHDECRDCLPGDARKVFTVVRTDDDPRTRR